MAQAVVNPAELFLIVPVTFSNIPIQEDYINSKTMLVSLIINEHKFLLF